MYTASELPEFLAAVSRAAEPAAALGKGVALVAETFDAEVVAVISGEEVIASVGFPQDAIVEIDVGCSSNTDRRSVPIDIPGFGPAMAAIVPLTAPDRMLLIGRADLPLDSIELAHAQAMARILALALRLLDKLQENERLLAEQRAHQAMLEAILRVQRLISQRQPIESILQAITEEAVSLLDVDLAGICVRTPQGLSQRALATAVDAGLELSTSARERYLLAIGERVDTNQLGGSTGVRVETTTGGYVDTTVNGATVFEGGQPIGELFVAAIDPTPRQVIDPAAVETFASQASIALTDASTVRELEHAFHDHLTGLPNRALFQDRFDHALALGQRLGTTTGLLFLDLDRFKAVNDTLGHAAGDALLAEVGAAIRRAGRSSDSVSRIGGDEFAVVLENTTPDAAKVVGHRLLEAVTHVVDPGRIAGGAAASIGIALSGPNCETTDELLRRADIAMYSVKTAGRAGVALYEPSMGTSRLDQKALTDALQTALVRDDFVVYYQPIVNLRTRWTSGVEALVRWHDPDRGLISPDAFIESAERSGMIVPIGRRVLETACEQAANWRRNLPGAADLSVSVNLSVRQLQHDDVEEHVMDTLNSTGLDPGGLTLEVTESVFVDDASAAGERLSSLKRLGVRLAIDDFGTGFSSLSYIHRYPFDVLKIDRAFVSGLGTSENGGAVLRTMLGLAGQLSMTAVAEGIETAAELAQLRALRCSHGQGFLFSPPVDAASLELLLTEKSRSFSGMET